MHSFVDTVLVLFAVSTPSPMQRAGAFQLLGPPGVALNQPGSLDNWSAAKWHAPPSALPIGSPRESPSSAVKWGMIIGGVAGATVATILVFRRPCQGDDCWIRPAVAILPIGIGAAVGLLVGGSIGRAIDGPGSSDYLDAPLSNQSAHFRVGLVIPLASR